MNYEIGKRYLITTSNWFYGPDGNSYTAVFGTLKGIHDDKAALGVSTNRHSTNWYIEIGDTTVAGCQVFYAIKCDTCSTEPPIREVDHEGKSCKNVGALSRIWFADEDAWCAV
jgi:hypothetical protein